VAGQRKLIRKNAFARVCCIAAALLLVSCGSSEDDNERGNRGPAAVGYVVVQPTSVPMYQELPGRVAAFQAVEVRPQASGVIQRLSFREGSYVRRGQTLYQIDPSQYQAQVAQAAANLRSAEANAEAARALAARYKPLVEIEAISKQDYTNAVSQARQAEAAIAQNRAALQTAQINLRYTRVPAPISGRAGLSNVDQGTLVTADQTNPLTTITQLDPIFVDIQQSAADLLNLRQSFAKGGVLPTTSQVRLKLPNGSDYGLTGTLDFSQVVVDQNTGTVTLRVNFPNPQSVLLPGMYVSARFSQAVNTSAFLVPQQAVSRDPKGTATLFVVGPENRAVQRTVVADRTEGPYWVITQGLAAGEKVITEGAGNLRDGAQIKPAPAKARGARPGSPAAAVKAQSGGKTG
jgi:membrane fusion protein (multidrug efflux system)